MRTLIVLAIALSACGPSSRTTGDDDPMIDAPDTACENNQHRCNASTYEVCSNGAWITQEECAAVCADGIGCVQCQPNTNICQDGNVHACDATGNVGAQVEACTGSTVCEGGACVNACDAAAENKSYQGCEYWTVDLDNALEVRGPQGSFACASTPGVKNMTIEACGNADNSATAGLCDPPNKACPSGYTCKVMNVCALDAQGSPYAVVVSNPQARAVNVTMTGPQGTSFMQSVPAGQVAVLEPQKKGIPDQSVDGTGKVKKAYKLVSDLPIVAYQFNPLDNANVFSNDASLLIPRTAFDKEYYVMTWPTLDRRSPAPGAQSYNGYLTVVAWQDNTVIEVTPTAAVRASATQPAIAAGVATMFTLNAFEVLTLQASGAGDLTGSRVRAVDDTQTFGVFAGHEAAAFGEMTPPNMTNTLGPCCADHLEEMMFGTSTWGKSFAISRSQSRGTNEPDVLRIIAQKDGTQLTFDPAPTGQCPVLQRGQHCQVKIAADTAITASEPILVAHYLQSAIWQDPFFGNSIGEGDPSLAIAVPVEQFRNDYTILIPASYGKNFMSISAPANGAVVVDGLTIQMTPFANGAYRAARHAVNAGQHKISCPAGCGVLVYGYSDAVSYMFAGGLDLKTIVIE